MYILRRHRSSGTKKRKNVIRGGTYAEKVVAKFVIRRKENRARSSSVDPVRKSDQLQYTRAALYIGQRSILIYTSRLRPSSSFYLYTINASTRLKN